jgi:hypothetical protein
MSVSLPFLYTSIEKAIVLLPQAAARLVASACQAIGSNVNERSALDIPPQVVLYLGKGKLDIKYPVK